MLHFAHAATDRLEAGDAAGVEIEVEGPRDAVERFCRRLETEAPSLARVEAAPKS